MNNGRKLSCCKVRVFGDEVTLLVRVVSGEC